MALSLLMMAALPVCVMAQDGLFQRGMTDESYYGFGGSNEKSGLLGDRSVSTGTINNQVFGQPAPLGSGVLLLIAAGAGYAVLKRKEDEK